MDRVIADGPFAVGFDAGLGWVALGTFTVTYHLVPGSKRYDLFPIAGYAVLASDEFVSHGVTVGGGTTYWPSAHVGLRVDAFRFLPVATDNHVAADQRSSSRFWGVRAGVAFRFG
jgi:hypothetical protein